MPIQSQTLELLARTKAFSLATIRFYSTLPRDTAGQILGRQLLRSATSVGAQYREAQRAKSIADFLSKTEGACRKLTKRGTGWNSSRNPESVPKAPPGR